MSLARHELEHELMGLGKGESSSSPPQQSWYSMPNAADSPGSTVLATGVASTPIEMRSDGSHWRPSNGSAGLFLMAWSYGIAPSAAISAGASGHLSVVTGFQHVYSEGIWLYLGASSDAVPAVSAGWYWVVMTSQTVGTVYTNGPGSVAFSFTAAGTITGVTAPVKMPFNFTLKGGLMPPNGLLEVSGMVLQSNASGSKIATVYFGGTAVLTTSNGSFYRRNLKGQITNKGVTNKQVASSWVADAGTTMSLGATADTTNDVLLEFELKTPDPAQYVIFDHLRCVLFA